MGEIKNRLSDFLSAAKEEAVTAVIESDAFPEVVRNIADVAVTEGTASVVGGVLGALAPRVHGVYLGYKEARFERHVLKALEEMKSRLDEIDQRLSALPEEERVRFQTEYSNWLLDSIYDEKQESKIPYYIQGFVSMMDKDTTDDTMLIFMDTLNQLTTMDIRVLGMYGFNDDNVYKVMNDFNVDNDELNTSKEKLVRFGLLLRKNDLQRDENLDGIAEYLTKIDKESKKTKPSKVRLPSIKKISNSESYKISSLGWKYLRRLGMTQF